MLTLLCSDFEEHLPERPTDITSNVEDDLEHKLNESIEDQPADGDYFSTSTSLILD